MSLPMICYDMNNKQRTLHQLFVIISVTTDFVSKKYTTCRLIYNKGASFIFTTALTDVDRF